MAQFKVLAIDDDDLVLQSIRIGLPDQWRLTGVNSLNEAPEDNYQAVLVDMHLTGNIDKAEGVEVIQQLNEANPHLEIVAMSGDLNRDLMEACLKAGASRFLAKPLSVDELTLTLDKIEGLLLLQNASNRTQTDSTPLIGDSSAIRDVKKQIASLRGESGPILIEGESGAGKEVVAGLIHSQGNEGPFIRVNIAAIPDNLFESELFGHVKGAFTGAEQNKMGLAEAAHNGDLFLDEIEALSLQLQVKLLRFLESNEVRRVGSDKTIHVNTRVIVATNRNLNDMVKNGEFREDLLWRISGKKLLLPTLRERKDDVPILCEHFLSQDEARKKQLSADAITQLKKYDWPGNVRELKRLCEQLIVNAPLPIIRGEDVSSMISGSNSNGSNPNNDSSTVSIDDTLSLVELVRDFEKHAIQYCLEKHQDIDKVGQQLQVSRSNLYKKIKDYNIDWRS